MRSLAFSLLIFLCCCSKKVSTTDFEGVAMTIPYHIKIGDKVENREEICQVIASSFAFIDATFNNYNPDSELSKLGALKAYEKVSISESMQSLMQLTEQIYKASEGRFDPTIAPLASLWKHCHSPDNALKECVGWSLIHFENGKFWKEKEETSLDFGGIAKGYCVDLLVENLEKLNLQNFYVEWGGEVRVKGHHPENRKWRVGIYGLDAVEMSDCAIATSGNYIQKWDVNGYVYTHIIDPRTKMPLQVVPNGISSATVVGKTCALCDAIATTLMLFSSEEEAMQWALQFPEIKVWLQKN